MTRPPLTLRLHGYPVSNWFNCVRAAMIEKKLGDEFQMCRAARDGAFLANSAMGKIPWLETPDGGLAESVAILEYLDDVSPAWPIYPADPFERARVRQIVNIAQLYIEVPMRALYPATFGGADPRQAPVAGSMETVQRALAALDQLCTFTPFVRGDDLTAADLTLFYTLELGERAARHLTGASLFDGRPRLAAWDAMMRARASTGTVLADFAPAFAEYCAQRDATWNETRYLEERFSHA
ncbi:MAG: glutathione S-transferase family protein [Novosphingobium sp.]